ncbi:hypothetical protein X559_2442 [Paenilisteria newyorkensis]|nr:hypothetical protein X559_2442 [Listeria newyorkensis]
MEHLLFDKRIMNFSGLQKVLTDGGSGGKVKEDYNSIW